jgi:hypothetical protein
MPKKLWGAKCKTNSINIWEEKCKISREVWEVKSKIISNSKKSFDEQNLELTNQKKNWEEKCKIPKSKLSLKMFEEQNAKFPIPNSFLMRKK